MSSQGPAGQSGYNYGPTRDAQDWTRQLKEKRLYTSYSDSVKDMAPSWMKFGNDIRLSFNQGRFSCAVENDDCDGNVFSGKIPFVVSEIPPPPATGLIYTGYALPGGTTTPDPDLVDGSAAWGTVDNSKITLLGTPGVTDGVIVPSHDGTGDPDYTKIAVYMVGYYRAPVTGSYVFNITHDDGFQLKVNGTFVLNSPGIGTVGSNVNSTPINLAAGEYYTFEGLWSNGTGVASLRFNSVKVDSVNIMPTYPLYNSFYASLP